MRSEPCYSTSRIVLYLSSHFAAFVQQSSQHTYFPHHYRLQHCRTRGLMERAPLLAVGKEAASKDLQLGRIGVDLGRKAEITR